MMESLDRILAHYGLFDFVVISKIEPRRRYGFQTGRADTPNVLVDPEPGEAETRDDSRAQNE